MSLYLITDIMNQSKEDYNRLLDRITKLMIDKGLKSLTMDSVAASLGMSKRTLYEIFDSKQQMFQEVLVYEHDRHIRRCTDIFRTSENTMEAMLRIYIGQRNLMTKVNPSFFRDMDNAFSEIKDLYENAEEDRHRKFLDMFNLGVKDGVFREDVNYTVTSKIFKIQMESLKRMEELFPPGLTLLDVYDNIIIGLLRSIATPKGMEILDKLTATFVPNSALKCINEK